MPDMDEIIRRIRRDMDSQLRKRARRALDDPAGWAVTGDGPGLGGRSPAPGREHEPTTGDPAPAAGQ
ncbi:hypothetical protein [Streptomyces mashuensis]|nr:hypothetical protein [Streptomyces mashuensis]